MPTLAVMKDVAGWRPQIDSKVDELKVSLTDLQAKVDKIAFRQDEIENLQAKVDKIDVRQDEIENPTYRVFDTEHLDFTKSKLTAAHLAATSLEAASGPERHYFAHAHRGPGHGVVTTLVPSPVIGAKMLPNLTPIPFSLAGASNMDTSYGSPNLNALLPQLDFSSFDGSSPKIWIKKCENFFEVYAIPPHLWMKFSTMYFTGSVAFWLQAMKATAINSSWAELWQAICCRFEEEQHNQLIRHFFHIRQFGNVVDYVEKFDLSSPSVTCS